MGRPAPGIQRDAAHAVHRFPGASFHERFAGRDGGFDLGEVYELSLGLGNDFVFQDQDIAGNEFLFLVFQRGQKQSCEGCSGTNFSLQGKRNDAQLWRARNGSVLAILRVGSLSVAGFERSMG